VRTRVTLLARLSLRIVSARNAIFSSLIDLHQCASNNSFFAARISGFSSRSSRKYHTFHSFNTLSFEIIATNFSKNNTRVIFFFSKRDAFRESLIYEWFLSKGERGKLAHIFPRREEGTAFLRYLDNLSDPLSEIKRVLSLCANLIPFLFCLVMYAYAGNTPRRRSRHRCVLYDA